MPVEDVTEHPQRVLCRYVVNSVLFHVAYRLTRGLETLQYLVLRVLAEEGYPAAWPRLNMLVAVPKGGGAISSLLPSPFGARPFGCYYVCQSSIVKALVEVSVCDGTIETYHRERLLVVDLQSTTSATLVALLSSEVIPRCRN